MIKLNLDHTTITSLANLNERMEFCDETGRTLGFFTPVHHTSLYDGIQSPASDAELRRREAEEIGRPLQEILASLRRRG